MTTSLEDARQALDTLPGLTWSGWSTDDLPGISAMLHAAERVDDPTERHSLEELVQYMSSQTYNLRRDALLARDECGDVVAIARSLCTDADEQIRRAEIMGAVHPERRGEGIGRAVMAWQVEHARAWFLDHLRPEHESLRLSLYSDMKAEREQRLAERFGLHRARFYAELTQRLPREPITVPDVPGVQIRPWERATPEATLAVRNLSFRDHWGSVDRPLQDWVEQQQLPSFRPDWSFVGVDAGTGQAVAFLMSAAYQQDWEPQGYTAGYIDMLGTLRDYRGRGLGRALVLRAMRAFQDSGMEAAEIGVDSENESGAFGLYRDLGFVEDSGTVLLRAEETPGA